ncbi:hypothetical protein BTR14_21970 [Rhizobium rhizosphaerae]|uniref:DUF1109 domain-containing protein n=1 Tax=Xaviernesmea rhizosphaerae TaxID=1672749 RepID=A0ABX3P8C4_9HYPH|nr:DUF1109 domain-containing protein [Xaviernesmea rhizosphaerae]OQP83664.1 hypothetical protein BTR14_21970 [Xaviernesmea rhizosphaerae]
MKTDELLTLLSADTAPVHPLRRMLSVALVVGFLVSALVMIATVGMRPDLAGAMIEPRVVVKLSVTLLAAASSAVLVFRVGRPGVPLGRALRALLLPAALLAAAVAIELSVLPPDHWMASLIGRNALFCLFFIPVLSAVPLIGFLWAMRDGAPERPGWAGAACGFSAATMAAFIYAFHCPDDSPLFVMTWYVIAIGLVTLTGAAAGRRLLRW